MKKKLYNILRTAYLCILLAMPITIHITKAMYWTVADPSQSFNTPDLCVYFAVPFIIAAALVWLILQQICWQKEAPKHASIDRDRTVKEIFWLLKFILWSAGGIYPLYHCLSGNHTWDLNWQWCVKTFQFITPALFVHITELIWKWYPVVMNEMRTDRNIILRIIFAGKSVLFKGIYDQKTMAEKLIYTIRVCWWFFVVLGVILHLPSYFGSDLSLWMSPWECFSMLGLCLINENTMIVLTGLRITELFFSISRK